jgi:hypothetical protein
MIQIVYTSVERQSFSSRQLKHLLLQSRLRNRDRGLSGMLVYHDGCFLQALEGPEREVMSTFERIQADPRHGELHIMGGPVAIHERSFGEWSMGYNDVNGSARLLKGFIACRTAFDAGRIDRPTALDFLDQCALERRMIA